ncbi:amino acid permease-domain-containing protein [Dactylonectria macrodidyma]|uniref:Amino acid permease-domain-containing protein n=1 Tax=Dactylonectria macrodidyma TaxID=307937 RepID=A0A9P9EN46_9HYPO|nr:amino acid permease-domain-containing protein [Dactylonectria macrodidyma]
MSVGHITVTRSVELVEMKAFSPSDNGSSWRMSIAKPPQEKDWMDSFRRANRRPIKSRDSAYLATPPPVMPRVGDRPGYYDVLAANAKTATTPLARRLKGRHLQMIAFGGAIGTGLFVASGAALYRAGPASVLLAYCLVGAMQYCTMQSLCELCVMFPIAGSFTAFSTRFLDPSWGFAIGWVYFLQWLWILPLEIIAAAFTISYWNDHLPNAVFITIFLIGILGINLFGIKAYGEAEFIFSIIKVVAVIAFILLGIIINIGGTPESGYIGGKYWGDPGPFKHGFKGFCSVLITAVFSFGGTELIGLAAAETASPLKSLPKAVKQVFWRIAIFYIVSILLVGLLVPSNEPTLVGGKNNADASASPFIIAIESAGTSVLPSAMNAIILIAVLSVGNSAVFGASRTLAALAELSYAPQIFSYVDKKGRPLITILLIGGVGLIAYLVDLSIHYTIFQWLLSISAFSTLLTWASICFCHIRFRMAWAHASRPLEQLPFCSNVGVYGSWFSLIGYTLVVTSQIWIAVSPVEIPGMDTSLSGRVQYFFLRVMALPLVIILFVYHKLRFRTSVIRVNEMDIETGRRFYRIFLTKEEAWEERRSWPRWKRIYYFLC